MKLLSESVSQLYTRSHTTNHTIIRIFNALYARLKTADSEAHPRCWISGGSVRKAYANEERKTSDYDVFFQNADDWNAARQKLMQNYIAKVDTLNSTTFVIYAGSLFEDNYQPPKRTGSSLAIKSIEPFDLKVTPELWPEEVITVQLICKYYCPFIHDMFERFDTTISQFAYWNGHFIMTPEAKRDWQNGIVDYYKEDCLPNPQRLYKFLIQGYEPAMRLYEKMFLNSDHENLNNGYYFPINPQDGDEYENF